MTSIPANLNCKTIKKKRGELKWSELVFEDEQGERCIPQIVVPELLSSSNRSVATTALHSDFNDSHGELSVLSIDEEASSLCESSVRSAERRPMKRRGSLGRFADRLGKRFTASDDDQTASTCAGSSLTTCPQTNNEALLSAPPPPPPAPPTHIRTDTPQLSNRFAFMNKQRANVTQKKYLGFKESQRNNQLSEERRGQVLSSLYTCMEVDDDEEDLLGNILGSTSSSAPCHRAPSSCNRQPIRYATANSAA
jgi:hypothetical protein